MPFQNVKPILSIGSPMSSMKLLLTVAASSRPKYRSFFLALLRPFVHGGEYSICYRCYERFYRAILRMSDLNADWVSVKELATGDAYRLERSFRPELVIDGGGNIGLFTLRAAAMAEPDTHPPTVVICEPLPRNIEQIRRHLAMNQVEAKVMPNCLGNSARTIPFYCRQANQSSFDSSEAYDSVMEIDVVTMQDAIGD